MQDGKLPIGTCIISGTLRDGRPRYTYYISPKKFYEYTGALVEGYYKIVGEDKKIEEAQKRNKAG